MGNPFKRTQAATPAEVQPGPSPSETTEAAKVQTIEAASGPFVCPRCGETMLVASNADAHARRHGLVEHAVHGG